MATAFISEPCASTTEPIRPSSISEKYSAAPNCKAAADSGTLAMATMKVETVPAKNEPNAAMESAAPARPFCAI